MKWSVNLFQQRSKFQQKDSHEICCRITFSNTAIRFQRNIFMKWDTDSLGTLPEDLLSRVAFYLSDCPLSILNSTFMFHRPTDGSIFLCLFLPDFQSTDQPIGRCSLFLISLSATPCFQNFPSLWISDWPTDRPTDKNFPSVGRTGWLLPLFWCFHVKDVNVSLTDLALVTLMKGCVWQSERKLFT